MKRILCLLLTLILLCSTFAGCVQDMKEPEEEPSTYLKPLDLMFEVLNRKDVPNYWKNISIMLNGFVEQDICDFYDILENSSDYQVWNSERNQKWQTNVSANQEQYGNDYVFSYRLDDQYALDSRQISMLQERYINERVQVWNRILTELRSATNETWQEIKYVSELSPEDRQQLLQTVERIYNAYLSAQITAGYQLTYTHITNGSKLETPIEKQDSMTVCLVDGNWVNIDRLYSEEGDTELTYATGLFFELLMSAGQ